VSCDQAVTDRLDAARRLRRRRSHQVLIRLEARTLNFAAPGSKAGESLYEPGPLNPALNHRMAGLIAAGYKIANVP
jgi:hypothetical protein